MENKYYPRSKLQGKTNVASGTRLEKKTTTNESNTKTNPLCSYKPRMNMEEE